MNKRENNLAWMRIAGYHDDRKAFTRPLAESGINRTVADAAFYRGQKQRASGMGCSCPACKRANEAPLPRAA